MHFSRSLFFISFVLSTSALGGDDDDDDDNQDVKMQAPPPPSIPTGETATKPDPTLKPSYEAEVSGKTLKLYMKLTKRFFDPQR